MLILMNSNYLIMDSNYLIMDSNHFIIDIIVGINKHKIDY